MSSTKLLSLFPLSIVAYPGEQLKLHIFEPRYVQMVNDCYAVGEGFGIVPVLNAKVQDYGTEMLITSINMIYPDGKMDIVVKAWAAFKVIRYFKQYPGKLYAAADIESIERKYIEDLNFKAEITQRLKTLFTLINMDKKFGNDKEYYINTFEIAHYIGLEIVEEYNLLLQIEEYDRQRIVLHQLNRIIPFIRNTNYIKDRISQNGHFYSLDSPDIEE